MRPSRSEATTDSRTLSSSWAWNRIADALPTGDDATVARQLRIARAHVAHVRAALQPEPAAPGEQLVTCVLCGLEGPPSTRYPEWCRACGISHAVQLARAAISAPPPPPPVPEQDRTCACGFVAKTLSGLSVHQARTHRQAPESAPAPAPEPVCAPEPAPLPPPPAPAMQPLRDEQPWRCECGAPFARSTRDPARCIRCTGEYARALGQQRQGYTWSEAL